jgi:Lar family restriction alleviation protein
MLADSGKFGGERMTEELKPCPFCGGKVHDTLNDDFVFHVSCINCRVAMWDDDEVSLYERWNRRAKE